MNIVKGGRLQRVLSADEHVYSVETHVWSGTLMNEVPGLDDLVTHTRAVENTRYWRERFTRPLNVGQSDKGCSFASTRGDVAYRYNAERSVVAHEMAHVISVGMHGPEWRSEYVALTELLYGAETADALHEAFVGNGLPTVRLEVSEGPLLPPELFYAEVGRITRPSAIQSERVFAL